MKNFRTSLLFLGIAVIITCVIYPMIIWICSQAFFPFQANGSLLRAQNGAIVGSKLIAQKFVEDYYFHPRPSAADYNAAYSLSSALAPSNYLLRARILKEVVRQGKLMDGTPIGPQIDAWFRANQFNGATGIVKQWAAMNEWLAKNWVESDPQHVQYIEVWVKTHPDVLQDFARDHPGVTPQVKDLATYFFASFSRAMPGQFPNATGAPLNNGPDIQALFFDMWLQDNKNIRLHNLPSDMVTTSASGLDPHITLANAQQQLDRVATSLASKTKGDATQIRKRITQIMDSQAFAPFGGLSGETLLNVLELNLALQQQYHVTNINTQS